MGVLQWWGAALGTNWEQDTVPEWLWEEHQRGRSEMNREILPLDGGGALEIPDPCWGH